ncbi:MULTISPECIES: hypothetical protein [Erysipelotrichaceae]|uniref:hypothetical protein n=1 Tax=Erysipelotrichaceae TaxID=128827 RepID=UPI000E557E31|nr:hypothetical protein [Absiella sp. AM27-20]RHU03303.1 hypothetical protein DW716_15895 [Absiella sp. AM27-20]
MSIEVNEAELRYLEQVKNGEREKEFNGVKVVACFDTTIAEGENEYELYDIIYWVNNKEGHVFVSGEIYNENDEVDKQLIEDILNQDCYYRELTNKPNISTCSPLLQEWIEMVNDSEYYCPAIYTEDFADKLALDPNLFDRTLTELERKAGDLYADNFEENEDGSLYGFTMLCGILECFLWNVPENKQEAYIVYIKEKDGSKWSNVITDNFQIARDYIKETADEHEEFNADSYIGDMCAYSCSLKEAHDNSAEFVYIGIDHVNINELFKLK